MVGRWRRRDFGVRWLSGNGLLSPCSHIYRRMLSRLPQWRAYPMYSYEYMLKEASWDENITELPSGCYCLTRRTWRRVSCHFQSWVSRQSRASNLRRTRGRLRGRQVWNARGRSGDSSSYARLVGGWGSGQKREGKKEKSRRNNEDVPRYLGSNIEHSSLPRYT